MKKQQSITTLPPSPSQERHQRMIRYSIAMTVRFVCFCLLFFVQGWWLLVVIVTALILPYVAVVVANVTVQQRQPTVVRPGAIVPFVRESER